MVAKFAMNSALEYVSRVTIAERGRDALKGQEKGMKKPHPVKDAVFVWRGGALLIPEN